MEADKQIDRLYTVPPGEFVERRNQLALSLRKDGNRGAADEVKRLRKPTAAAWTVNQLARREKMRLRSLLTAGERLRKAHEKLLGGGSPQALQQARDDERHAIQELARAAEALLEQAGHPPNEATLERVRETLHAAAADEGIGQRVREGRLEREERAAGFGFGNLPAASPTKRGQERKTRRDEAAREKHRQAEERLRDARRDVKEAEQAVKKQARELGRAEDALRSRQVDVERAEKEVERTRGPRA